MTPEEIEKVEDIVNNEIAENLPVITKEMSLEDAKKTGGYGIVWRKIW